MTSQCHMRVTIYLYVVCHGNMHRYAVYYAPRNGAFAGHAARWLNDDAGIIALPASAEILTRDARRYGFHGTLRAPFRPANGISENDIVTEIAALALRLKPVECTGLHLENLDGFLALTPTGNTTALAALAASVVRATNPLRAPMTEADIARRRPDSLTSRQRALMGAWGYPFVMDEFRFHLTLTDRLTPEQIPQVMQALHAYFNPVLPHPFCVEDLCLFGEDAAGAFHLLHRYPLSG
ncbi:DUF1045 domain-containing protein [Pseudorhodobacter ferrugineus]|uniref:DUF1045 domain-containing protein n=1 Tax=Pseudorhodobacter ferrugineus TaxID=77008 RepID=UPI001E47D8AB|nr:DUF1045 domain-containing protein [Pseudorhodobacter ferrugineus]